MHQKNGQIIARKRNRRSLVCNPCKQRKIKCDKGKPCSGCVAKKIESLCHYDDQSIRKKKGEVNNSEDEDKESIYSFGIFPSVEPNCNDTKIKETDSGNTSMLLVEQSQLEDMKAKLRKYEEMIQGNKSLGGTTETVLLFDDGITRKTALNQHVGECPMRGKVLHNPKLPGETNNSCFCSLLDETNKNEKYSEVDQILNEEYIPRNPYIGINPYQDKEETINLFDNINFVDTREPSRTYNGVFNWSSVWRHDKALALLKQYSQLEKFQSGKGGTLILSKGKDSTLERSSTKLATGQKSQNFVTEFSPDPNQHAITGTDKATTDNSSTFERKLLQANSYAPYKAVDSHKHNSKRRKLKDGHSNIGLTLFDSQLDRELKLIEELKITFPKAKVVWLLLTRFFRILYPFFPFLDEQDFRRDIAKIIGPESYEDVKLRRMHVEKRIDLATLGTLLVVLRLSYLSLFSNRCSVNTHKLNTQDQSTEAQVTKYLLSNPIHVNSIDTAESCLHQFYCLRKYNLTVLQCALFIRLYRKYAPEEGDGADGGDSQTSSPLLIHMAYSIGVNRDPDCIKISVDNKRLHNLGRKIWHSLLVDDFMNAFTFGSPLASSGMFYDTKEPYFTNENANALNKKLDEEIAKCHGYDGGLIFGPMKDILAMTFSLKKNIKMSELTFHLNSLEICPSKLFGELGDYTNIVESEGEIYAFVKMKKVQILLALKGFYLSVHAYLASHYHNTKNYAISFFYLRKLLTMSIGELSPNIFLLICKGQEIFGEGADLIINPQLERNLHVINEINISALVRVSFSLYRMRANPEHQNKLKLDANYKLRFESLAKLIVLLENCARVCVLGTSIMSQRYYYAWGLNRSHSFLLRIIKNEEFYAQNIHNDIGVENISTPQLHELIDILEKSFMQLNSVVSAHCEDEQVLKLFDLKNQPQIPSILLNDSEITTSETLPNMALGQAEIYNHTHMNPQSGINDPIMESSDIHNFNLDSSAEIDSLWFQMLAMKNQNRNFIHQDYAAWNGYSPTSTDSQKTPSFGNHVWDPIQDQSQSPNQFHPPNQIQSQNQFQVPNQFQAQNKLNSQTQDQSQSHGQMQDQNHPNHTTSSAPNANPLHSINNSITGYNNPLIDIVNTDDIDMFSDLPLDQIFNLSIL